MRSPPSPENSTSQTGDGPYASSSCRVSVTGSASSRAAAMRTAHHASRPSGSVAVTLCSASSGSERSNRGMFSSYWQQVRSFGEYRSSTTSPTWVQPRSFIRAVVPPG
jgi:hypothetical protein